MSALRGVEAAAFVGRHREVEQLAGALSRAGAVAVIAGMPGSGKTALAAHVALSVPGLTAADVAFATATDLRRDRFDLKHYDSSPLLIADGLRRREINALLANRNRPPHVVVTTRDLGCQPRKASLVRLEPLSEDEGTRLLGFLAGSQRVSREGEAATEIVHLCGGLPLALSAAGRQLASQPRTALKEFAEQMRRRRWRDESRQGLASAIDDARKSLPDAARRAFSLLALAGETFAGALWDAIVEVLAPPDRAALANALVHAGLLESQGDGAWRAHPLVVSFAQAQLSRDAALRATATAAMIRWYARSLPPAAEDLPALLRAVQVAAAWAPRPALDDLVAVADATLTLLWDKRWWPHWEQLHRAVRFAADRFLEPHLQTRAAANQVIGYLAQHRLVDANAELRHAARSRPEGYPPAAAARLWLHEVTLRWLQGDLDGAERLATRALAEANRVEDAGMVLLVRTAWAHLERDRGNVSAAVAQWTDIARDAAREALPELETLALLRAARGSVELGAVDRARELLARAVSTSAGAVPHGAIALAEQARLEHANGHAGRAYPSARRAAEIQLGPASTFETGPKWIWWPRAVLYGVPVALAVAAVSGLAALEVPLHALVAVAALLAAPVGGFVQWAHRTRERLTLNVWRAMQRWLDAPELAAEVVPLSHLHYDRLGGGDS